MSRKAKLNAALILLSCAIVLSVVLIVGLSQGFLFKTAITTTVYKTLNTVVEKSCTNICSNVTNTYIIPTMEQNVTTAVANASAQIKDRIEKAKAQSTESFAKLCDSPAYNFTCLNGGKPNTNCTVCTDCDNLFSGTTCSTCEAKCANGGTMNMTSCTCSCPSWTSGPTCSDCALTCQNGGNLTSSTECKCTCPTVWTGTDCSEANPESTAEQFLATFNETINGTLSFGKDSPKATSNKTCIPIVTSLGHGINPYSSTITTWSTALELQDECTTSVSVPGGVNICVPCNIDLQLLSSSPTFQLQQNSGVILSKNEAEALFEQSDTQGIRETYLFLTQFGDTLASLQAEVFSGDVFLAYAQHKYRFSKSILNVDGEVGLKSSAVKAVHELVAAQAKDPTMDISEYWNILFSMFPPMVIVEAVEGGLLEYVAKLPISYSFAFGTQGWPMTDSLIGEQAMTSMQGILGLGQTTPVKSSYADSVQTSYTICAGGNAGELPSNVTNCFADLNTYLESVPKNPALLEYKTMPWPLLLKDDEARNATMIQMIKFLNASQQAIDAIVSCPSCTVGSCKNDSSFCTCPNENYSGRGCGGCKAGWKGPNCTDADTVSVSNDMTVTSEFAPSTECRPLQSSFTGGLSLETTSDGYWKASKGTWQCVPYA